MPKGQRRQYEGDPWDKFGTIWALKRMTTLEKVFN